MTESLWQRSERAPVVVVLAVFAVLWETAVRAVARDSSCRRRPDHPGLRVGAGYFMAALSSPC